MYFNTSFFLTEFCPPKYNQTQVNDCRIESINITTEIKDTSLEFFLCLLQPCNKQEIQKLEQSARVKGYTVVPVRINCSWLHFSQDLNGMFSLDGLPMQ